MTDLEITKLAAEAMGYIRGAGETGFPRVQLVGKGFQFIQAPSEGEYPPYDPLHDDAQALQLLKRFPERCIDALVAHYHNGSNTDYNRVICEAVSNGV